MVDRILMDIHVLVNWQLSKMASIDQCHRLYHVLKCTTHWGDVEPKIIRWPVIGFDWSQA